MKKIKGAIIGHHWGYHNGGHRSSNGYTSRFIEKSEYKGPFFSEIIPLSYRDSISLSSFANSVTSHLQKEWEEEEIAGGWGWHSDYDKESIEDLGLCEFFNENFSTKYGILLEPASKKEECIFNFKDGILKTVNDAIENSKRDIDKKILQSQNEIKELENKILNIKDEISRFKSIEFAIQNNMAFLYQSIKSKINLFEFNEPILNNVYLLDLAKSNNDTELLNILINGGAYAYGQGFFPELSASIGDYSKVLKILERESIEEEDINKVFKFFTLIPTKEFFQVFSRNFKDVFRNERIVVNGQQCSIIKEGLINYYKNRKIYYDSYSWCEYGFKEPITLFLIDFLKNKEYLKANFMYQWLHDNKIWQIHDDTWLLLSFKYSNMDYLNRFEFEELVWKIIEYRNWEPELKTDYQYLKISENSESKELLNKLTHEFFSNLKKYYL